MGCGPYSGAPSSLVELIDPACGTANDSARGITWLTDADYAQTSGYDS
jgi:hypothetical protein